MGLTIGNLLSVGVLFTATEAIGNQYLAWSIMAGLQVTFACILVFMIDEPDIYNAKEERHKNKKSFCG